MSTISNQTITQTVTLGVVDNYPTYASPLKITATGMIAAAAGAGITSAQVGTVANFGTVAAGNGGAGIDLATGGSIANGSTSTMTALIAGGCRL